MFCRGPCFSGQGEFVRVMVYFGIRVLDLYVRVCQAFCTTPQDHAQLGRC